MRRKGERGKERRRTLSLSLSLFPPLLFSEFSFFIIFFFNDKGNSTCFNILKTLLVFHPLPVETLFRGVACAMLRVAFTGHVSPLPCFLLPPPPPPFPLVCFAYFEAEHLTDENIFLCTRPWRTMQPACNNHLPRPLFRFHGCTWKRRKIDAALITLSRQKRRKKKKKTF